MKSANLLVTYFHSFNLSPSSLETFVKKYHFDFLYANDFVHYRSHFDNDAGSEAPCFNVQSLYTMVILYLF